MNNNISNEPISMLIAVPENLYYRKFITYLISMHTIETLGFAESSSEIITMTLELQTDIIVVDISFLSHNLVNNLKEIRKSYYKGNIIVIVDEFEDSLKCVINECDKIFFIKRPNNSVELADQVMLVSQHSLVDDSFSKADVLKEDSDFNFPGELYKAATKLLLSCGFNSKHKGFIYLREASMLKSLVRDVGSLSKNVYPYIAKRYNVSSVSIERAIRSAVNYVWNINKLEYMAKLGVEYSYVDKPSNAIIISHISDIIKGKRIY